MKTFDYMIATPLLLMFFGADFSALAQTPVSFSGPLAYLGNSPAIADFNGDGIPDLATVDQTTALIHIHTGAGNGTFAGDRVIDLSAAEGGRENILVATADFNLDGLPDLVVGTGGDSPIVFTLLGKPGGGFAAPSASTVVEHLQNFYIADLNGDGKPDLVMVVQGYVSVLLGVGDGTFQRQIYVFAQQLPAASLAIADFNGDNKPDLAIPTANGIFILFGDGTGRFPTGTTFTTTVEFGPIAAADVNGDGQQDLIAESIAKGLVEVLPGNGRGGFGVPQLYIIGKSEEGNNTFNGLAVGDVNGDGIPDIVTPDPAVLFGKVDGTFELPVVYPANGYWNSVQLFDLRGDGRLDIIGNSGEFIASSTTVLLNSGLGQFQGGVTVKLASSATCVAVADFNGDEHDDAAVGIGTGVEILLGTGRPTLPLRPSSSISLAKAQEPCPVSGDFNNDGIPDLVVREGAAGFSYLEGRGDGTFAPPVRSPQDLYPLVIGDFNGDRTLDVAGISGNTEVEILLGNGTGEFAEYTSFPTPEGNSELFAADLNGDGLTDLILLTASGSTQQFTVYLNQGGGAFKSEAYPVPVGTFSSCVVVGDLNNDGIPDLVIIEEPQSYVFLGKGDGTFLPMSDIAASGITGVLADLNGDGLPDLVVSDNYEVKIFLGNGAGGFSFPGNPNGLWFAPPNPASIAAAFLQSQPPDSGLADLITVGAALDGNYAGILLNRAVPHQ